MSLYIHTNRKYDLNLWSESTTNKWPRCETDVPITNGATQIKSTIYTHDDGPSLLLPNIQTCLPHKRKPIDARSSVHLYIYQSNPTVSMTSIDICIYYKYIYIYACVYNIHKHVLTYRGKQMFNSPFIPLRTIRYIVVRDRFKYISSIGQRTLHLVRVKMI